MKAPNFKLEHVSDLDRGRIAHVLSQQVKDVPADPLFLSLPQDETYAINSVARFLKTHSKIKIFGNNNTSYKAVFTNLGRNENVYMHSDYLGIRAGKYGASDSYATQRHNFHPLLTQSKTQEFICYDDDKIVAQTRSFNIIVGNEARFAAELVQSLHTSRAKLNLVVVMVENQKHIDILSDVFQTGWTQASYTVGTGKNTQYNFLAWAYDLPLKTVCAIIQNIHPLN